MIFRDSKSSLEKLAPLQGYIAMVLYCKVQVFICTGRLVYKDYCICIKCMKNWPVINTSLEGRVCRKNA